MYHNITPGLSEHWETRNLLPHRQEDGDPHEHPADDLRGDEHADDVILGAHVTLQVVEHRVQAAHPGAAVSLLRAGLRGGGHAEGL